ncbi:uncharacterized protein BDV14DRAFT_198296 [Aspergillus stella-maris]|uniref:uncharacterized protein n=1 Tax=Aspergillus stella-maris TaxID=1810926 RepID=UPI003CCDD25E
MKTLKTDASAGAVSRLSVLSSEHSSPKLSWNSVSNALGYNIFSRKCVIASVPSSMITSTMGGFKSGTIYSLHVIAAVGSGNLGSPSNTVTVSTMFLPDGSTISDYKASPGANSTIFTGGILVPYAFFRVYIWDSADCEFDTNTGRSVNPKIDDCVCAHYNVEGSTLAVAGAYDYKISGMCTTPGLLAWCDHIVNTLYRNDDPFYTGG